MEHVNAVETAGELAALRQSLRRGASFGTAAWQRETVQRLGLASTLKPLGRPQKRKAATGTGTSLFDISSHVIAPANYESRPLFFSMSLNEEIHIILTHRSSDPQ